MPQELVWLCVQEKGENVRSSVSDSCPNGLSCLKIGYNVRNWSPKRTVIDVKTVLHVSVRPFGKIYGTSKCCYQGVVKHAWA